MPMVVQALALEAQVAPTKAMVPRVAVENVAIAEVVKGIQIHITKMVEKLKPNCARKKDHVLYQGMEIMRNLSVRILMPSASKL